MVTRASEGDWRIYAAPSNRCQRSGPNKRGQFPHVAIWEQRRPGQCFGPLIQVPTVSPIAA